MSANVGNVTENYLIPTKASIVTPSDIIDKCPTLSNVTDILDKNTGSKNKIIFFDACRSMESFETSYRGLFSRGNASNSISTKSYDKIWIYYSASEGQKAYDGPKDGNSPFCDALSYYSLKPDLSVADLGNNISDYVVNYCNQHNLNEQTPVLQQSGPMLLSLNPAKNMTEQDDSFTSQNILSILKNKKENQTDIYAGIGYGKSGYNYPYFSLGINLNDHLPVLKSLNIEIDCAFPYNSQTSVYWMPNEGTNSLSGVWDYKKQYILFTELGYRMSLSKKNKFYLTPQLGISMEQYKGDAQNSTEYSLQHSWSLFMNARTKFDYYISNHISLFGIAHYDIFPFKYGKIAQTLEDGANLINDWNKGLYIKRLSLIFGIGYNF